MLTGNVGHATFVNLSPKTIRKWSVLMSSSRADRFDVPLAFLSQQAELLYERQMSQVRAGLQKANRLSLGASPTPSSISGSGTAGGHAMTRGGSGGTDHSRTTPFVVSIFANPASGSRVPSSLSHRAKERTTSRCETSTEFSRTARRIFPCLPQHYRGSLCS